MVNVPYTVQCIFEILFSYSGPPKFWYSFWSLLMKLWCSTSLRLPHSYEEPFLSYLYGTLPPFPSYLCRAKIVSVTKEALVPVNGTLRPWVLGTTTLLFRALASWCGGRKEEQEAGRVGAEEGRKKALEHQRLGKKLRSYGQEERMEKIV